MKFHIEVNDWGSLTLFWLSEWGRSEETQHVSGCFMSAEKKGGSQNDTPACRRCSHESLWSRASLGPKKAYSMIGGGGGGSLRMLSISWHFYSL